MQTVIETKALCKQYGRPYMGGPYKLKKGENL